MSNLSEFFRDAGRVIGTHMDLNEYDLVVDLGQDVTDSDNQMLYVANVSQDPSQGAVDYSHIETEPREDMPSNVLSVADLDPAKFAQTAQQLEADVIGGIRGMPNYEQFGLMDDKGFKDAAEELWRLKEVYPEGSENQVLAEDLYQKAVDAVTNRAIAASMPQIKADMIEKINAHDDIRPDQKVDFLTSLKGEESSPESVPAQQNPGFTP